MGHPFVLRPGTLHEEAFRADTIGNEYRLPDSFDPDDIIVDIGSHAGSYCYAALQRGSNRVYGLEADVEYYRCAVRNLQSFGGRVRLENRAV